MLKAISSQSNTLPGELSRQILPQDLEQAAEQFEAMFLHSLVQQMRSASQALVNDNPFDSKQQRLMRDFYDDKLSSQLASQRSTGIAQMIIAQLGQQDLGGLKNSQVIAALNEYPKQSMSPNELKMHRGQE